MYRKHLAIFLLILINGCASTNTIRSDAMDLQNTNCFEASKNSREISSLKCVDLFSSEKNKMTEKTIEIVKDLTPGVIAEEFWSLVKNLSLNSNSKIDISSDKIELTEVLDNKNDKIYTTYVYNSVRNEFVAESVTILEHGTTKVIDVIQSEVKTDSDFDFLIQSSISQQSKKIKLKKSISYALYEKIKNELHNFDFFTSHELYKISLLEPKSRVAKYNFILNSRKIKKYIANTILEDFIYSPLRTFVVSVVSIYAISNHFDVKQMIGKSDEKVPEWVAPSIVNMSQGKNADFNNETVRLMKIINTTENEKAAPDNELSKKAADTIKINETDFYMIKSIKEKDNQKTYFILTHEKENGSMDVFYQQIDPNRFPQLIESSVSNEK